MSIQNIEKLLWTEINPVIDTEPNKKQASVMMIIFGEPPKILMIKKPISMSFHGGEIAFPGGKVSQEDKNLLDTAIRETKEETGMIIKSEKIIGQLNPVTTLNSGFTILPFVCITEKISKLVPNSEVAEFLEIPLIPLLKTLDNDLDPDHNSIKEMYTFAFEEKIIWGASARMLKQITEKLDIDN